MVHFIGSVQNSSVLVKGIATRGHQSRVLEL